MSTTPISLRIWFIRDQACLDIPAAEYDRLRTALEERPDGIFDCQTDAGDECAFRLSEVATIILRTEEGAAKAKELDAEAKARQGFDA